MGNEARRTNKETVIGENAKEDKMHMNPMKWKDPQKTAAD